MVEVLQEISDSLWHNRWQAIWQRHFAVWQKLMGPSMMANFAEPIMTIAALGYGLGFFIGNIGDMPYMLFLAAGLVCASCMQTASFEAQYSAYTRMDVQYTWDAMLATPLNIADVVLGEVSWAACKSLFSTAAIVLVAALLGAVGSWWVLAIPPALLLAAIGFAGMALIMTSQAKNYDFFLYYQTLLMVPMILLSGVYFPLENLPPLIQFIALCLPLANLVEIVRPLMSGHGELPLNDLLRHLGILLAYAVVSLMFAVYLLKRRMYR